MSASEKPRLGAQADGAKAGFVEIGPCGDPKPCRQGWARSGVGVRLTVRHTALLGAEAAIGATTGAASTWHRRRPCALERFKGRVAADCSRRLEDEGRGRWP